MTLGDNSDNTGLSMDIVREWVMGTRGWFESREMFAHLRIISRPGHLKANTYLARLAKEEKLISRHPTHNGRYRLIDKGREELDWRNANTDNTVNLEWSFGLHHLTMLYPKSVVIIAGTSNAGKTAFVLDFIARNQSKYQIDYYTSEMGGEELKFRLQQFQYGDRPMCIDDWRMRTFGRAENFSDVIEPDVISVCDFLEVRNDFWTVGTEIHEIWNALTTGIAVVCLQKQDGAVMGIGGQFSEHKSRLYLNLDKDFTKGTHTMTIRKAKLPKHQQVNPNYLKWDYTISHGWQFNITRGPYRGKGESARNVILPPDLAMSMADDK